MKNTPTRVRQDASPMSRIAYGALSLDEDDPLRAQIVRRIRLEYKESDSSAKKLSESWKVSVRQVQRMLSQYRATGEIVEKETVGQKIKRALAERSE